MVGEAATFKDYGNLAEAVNALLRPRLNKLGQAEAMKIKYDIGVVCVGHRNHSKPGQPPRAEFFKLQRSVRHRIVNRGGSLDSLELRAQRTNDKTGDPKVAIYLELGTRNMGARPFMALALARVSSSATKSLGTN